MSETTMILETDFKNESDVDLLTWISMRKEDEDVSRRAWCEFYTRYFELLSLYCIKRFEKRIGIHGVEDLVNDTFLRVFEGGADTFKTDESCPERLRNQIGAWLGKIAHNLFLKQLRGQKHLQEVPIVDDFNFQAKKEPMPSELLDDEETMSSELLDKCKRLQEVLDGLSPREYDILMTRFANYHRSDGKQQFHPDDLERLAETWKITKDYVRQIYCRTFNKVKERLS